MGEDIVQTSKIMGASSDGNGSGQSLGAVDGHAVAELFHLLLVDVGPIHGQGPRAVKANIGGAVEGINVGFQAREHIRARVKLGGPILARFPKGSPDDVVIKFVENHLLEPIGVRTAQDAPLPVVDGIFPRRVIGQGVVCDGKRI